METKWRQKWRRNGDKKNTKCTQYGGNMETKLRPHGDQPETKCQLLRGKSEEKYDHMEAIWTQDGHTN